MRIDDSGSRVEISCPSCSAVNRVPADRLHQRPVCGRCRTRLAVDRPLSATDRTFGPLVRAASVPVLVDFWAPWCGPCRMVGPELEKVARARAGEVLVIKVNSDENPEVSASHGIRSIPSLLVYRGGREVNRVAGAMPAAEIMRLL